MIAHRCELRVRDRFGSAITGSPKLPAVDVSFSVALGGGGFLSAETSALAEPVASSPGILDDCVVILAIPLDGTDTPTEVVGYAPRTRDGVLWSGAGGQVRRIESAGTLWTVWAQDALLLPESNVLAQMSEAQRYFGPQATIYDPDADPDYTWLTPSTTVGQQDSTTGARAGKPADWPAALGNAYWITRPSGGDLTETRHLFIRDVTFETAGMRRFWVSSDESAAVYAAGALVCQTSSSETGYEHADTWDAWIWGGTTMRILIDKTSAVSRGGDGHDPVLLGIATIDDEDTIVSVDLVTDGDWQVFTMDPVTGVAPSLTPGQIMLELHSQAESRGVNTWAAITPTFTATADTDSTAWGLREERTWRVGYERHLDMVQGLGDLGVDVEITPALDFNAYYARGSDVSASVVIEALVNADDISERGERVEATWLAVETQDGWIPDGLTNAAALAAYGRREGSLSLGNAPSIAQGARLGQRVLDERLSRPNTEWSVEFYAVAGCVPFVDFGLGDTVAVKIGATSTDRVVLAIGGSAPSVSDIVRWNIKAGPVLA